MLCLRETPVRWPGFVLLLMMIAGVAAPHAMADEKEASEDEPQLLAHPLEKTIQYANARAAYIRDHVRDYTCQLVKRERIGGTLQLYQYALTKVRCEQLDDGKVVQPLAVLMQFQKPSSIKGRTVLFVAGENDGMVLVRKGGRGTLKNVELEFHPQGTAAKRESNHPITDIGLSKLIERLVARIEADIKQDPMGTNTEVSYFRKAKVNGRLCTHIQVVHPRREDGFDYHEASLYVDDEMQVPVRLIAYDWPEKEEEGDKPVLEEYNYINLKLNVGVPDDEFRKSTYFDEE